jgi:hypothetical protein
LDCGLIRDYRFHRYQAVINGVVVPQNFILVLSFELQNEKVHRIKDKNLRAVVMIGIPFFLVSKLIALK